MNALRRALGTIALSVTTTLGFLAILEYGTRLIEGEGQAPPSSRLGRKGRGEFRVMVYGGSTAYGWPVPELGFVSQIRFALRGACRDRPIEIVNLAYLAMDSTQVLSELRASIGKEPDLLVVMTGHNEFIPQLDPSATLHIARALDRLALVRMMRRTARELLHGGGVAPPRPFDRGAEFQRRVRAFETNIDAMVDLARERSIAMVLATLPANLVDWPPLEAPDDRGKDASLRSRLDRIEALAATGDIEAARPQCSDVARAAADDAQVHYRLGRLWMTLGDPGAAATSLSRARDLDPYPWRVLTSFNETIREASVRARLVDLERRFEAASPDGLVGFGLIADNCHPTPEGHHLIAEALLPPILEAAGCREGPVRVSLEDFLAQLQDRKRIERKYLLANAKYCVRLPIGHVTASRMYLERALAKGLEDWEVWANLACVALLQGDRERGRSALDRALALAGGGADRLLDDRAVPRLAEALAREGIDLESGTP